MRSVDNWELEQSSEALRMPIPLPIGGRDARLPFPSPPDDGAAAAEKDCKDARQDGTSEPEERESDVRPAE